MGLTDRKPTSKKFGWPEGNAGSHPSNSAGEEHRLPATPSAFTGAFPGNRHFTAIAFHGEPVWPAIKFPGKWLGIIREYWAAQAGIGRLGPFSDTGVAKNYPRARADNKVTRAIGDCKYRYRGLKLRGATAPALTKPY